ncbi:MAG: PQQ-binding-like beta-propeller repeat protein, partial [Planctomycetaceae bacterium]
QANLTQRGAWSWHGTFTPDPPGTWRCELHAIDVTGAVWKRSHTVNVEPIQQEPGVVGADFPWVLAGDPPRHIDNGPQPPLTPLWVTHTQGVHVLHSSPVVADGRVYVAVGNPNAGASGGVLCLNATTGQTLWRADSPLGDIRGSVTVHGKAVYAITGGGWIAAFDSETGRNLWNRPLQADYRLGRPLAINNTPPVPTRFGLLVSDWQKPQMLLDYTSGVTLATLAGDVGSYSAFATVFDDVMYCVRRGGGVALHLPDGKVQWTIEETSRSTSASIVVGDKLIYNGSSGVKVRDAANGELIWQAGAANAGYQNAIPIVWNKQLLVNGTDFRAWDLQSGKTRWTIDCAREADRFVRSRRQAMAGSSTPLIGGDDAYFGHDDTSIRATTYDGNVVWEYRLGTPIKTAPSASGNLLFVHDYAGNLWCFAGASRQ